MKHLPLVLALLVSISFSCFFSFLWGLDVKAHDFLDAEQVLQDARVMRDLSDARLAGWTGLSLEEVRGCLWRAP